MRIAIVTALANGAGLERDFQLLSRVLSARGHEVTGVAFRGAPPSRAFDLTIFLEVFHERFAGMAPRAWMVPNPEWWDSTPFLDCFELVLCKTRDCERIFAPLVGERAIFTGWLSQDMHDPDVPRERRFMHAAGKSPTKGTRAVINAWKEIGERAPLVIIGATDLRREAIRGGLRGVVFCDRLREDAYRRLQNAAMFHLCCSEYEGWGHGLHEALSVGAAIATTHAPPMCETDGIACVVPPVRQSTQRLARMSFVDAAGVRAAVEQMVAMSDGAIADVRDRARAAFHEAQNDFALRFGPLL